MKNTHSFHQFVIRTKKEIHFPLFLKKYKIQTMVHYPYMLNELKFFNGKEVKKAKDLGKKILSLPISEEHSDDQIKYVVQKINSYFKKIIKYEKNHNNRFG